MNKLFVIDKSDLRNLYLKKMLEDDGYMAFDFDESVICPASNIVYIFAPSRRVTQAEAKRVRNGSTVFLFSADAEARGDFLLRDVRALNIMDDEIFAYKNAMLTAEGVLPIIITNTERSLKSTSVLVTGLGRVGKSVCAELKNLGAHVVPVATTEEEKCVSCLYVTDDFLTTDNFAENIHDFHVIINTVPAPILGAEVLEKTRSGVLIIDLASAPGGADFAYCGEKNINITHALGIPGKTAPLDAARFLKERIYRAI